MAKFHTTGGIVHEIETLIKEARDKLIFVSPYLQINKLLIPRLKDASERNVAITIVYRVDAKSTNAEIEKLKEIKGLTIYGIENLHSKCFMNEKRLLLTSMNLYEYSEKNNREMGIALTLADDEDLYKDAVEEVQSIIRASKPIKELIKPKAVEKTVHTNFLFNTTKQTTTNTNEGYCIRCGDGMRHGLHAPLCKTCYNVWSEYGNREYLENFCHSCRKPHDTTIDAPQCYPCYKKTNARQAAW